MTDHGAWVVDRPWTGRADPRRVCLDMPSRDRSRQRVVDRVSWLVWRGSVDRLGDRIGDLTYLRVRETVFWCVDNR